MEVRTVKGRRVQIPSQKGATTEGSPGARHDHDEFSQSPSQGRRTPSRNVFSPGPGSPDRGHSRASTRGPQLSEQNSQAMLVDGREISAEDAELVEAAVRDPKLRAELERLYALEQECKAALECVVTSRMKPKAHALALNLKKNSKTPKPQTGPKLSTLNAERSSPVPPWYLWGMTAQSLTCAAPS